MSSRSIRLPERVSRRRPGAVPEVHEVPWIGAPDEVERPGDAAGAGVVEVHHAARGHDRREEDGELAPHVEIFVAAVEEGELHSRRLPDEPLEEGETVAHVKAHPGLETGGG